MTAPLDMNAAASATLAHVPAEALGTRYELGRTHAEIARRLPEGQRLSGLDRNEHRDRAAAIEAALATSGGEP